MPQFTIYKNKNPRSRAEVPYLLDIQNDLLSDLNTRVVVPLFLKKTPKVKPITRLTPEFEIEGRKLVLMTPQLAGISLTDLGEPAGSLKESRAKVIGALDLLITGF